MDRIAELDAAFVEAALATSTYEARVRELSADGAPETPAVLAQKAEATRQWVDAVERACRLGHVLALCERATKQADPGEATRAEAFLHQMQELLRDAKELAARMG
jgi:hypothetical protein